MSLRTLLFAMAATALLVQAAVWRPPPASNLPASPPVASRRSPPPAVLAEEADWDAIGRLLKAVEQRSPDVSVRSSALQAKPDLVNPVLRYYRRQQGDDPGRSANDEEALAFDYLFGDEKRAAQTLKALGEWICFWRMDRVWPGPRETTSPGDLPEWAACPVHGTRYEASARSLRCPSHGFEMRTDHPTPENLPSEDVRQLAMGYFAEKRSHNLDAALDPALPCGVQPGETVVDLGSGVGCYTWPMAERAGPKGRVVAVDIDPGVLEFVRFVAKRRPEVRVDTALATRESPALPAGQADRIYMVDVYNVIAGNDLKMRGGPGKKASGYMAKVRDALRPGGHLVVIDFLPERGQLHVPEENAIRDMEALGFRLADRRRLEAVPMYALTFKK